MAPLEWLSIITIRHDPVFSENLIELISRIHAYFGQPFLFDLYNIR